MWFFLLFPTVFCTFARTQAHQPPHFHDLSTWSSGSTEILTSSMGSTSPIEAESGDNGDNGDKGGSSSSWDRTSKTRQTYEKVNWAETNRLGLNSVYSINSGTNKKKHGNCHNLPKIKKNVRGILLCHLVSRPISFTSSRMPSSSWASWLFKKALG